MTLFKLTLLTCLLYYSNANCDENLDRVQKTVHELIDKCFPQLKELNIQIESMQSDSVFFETDVAMTTILQDSSKRRYILRYNPKFFIAPPNPIALTSIMAHELCHITDYGQMSSWELIGFGLKYMINSKYRTEYERSTDMKALNLGFAEGLGQFRTWLYKNISTQDVELKKRNYWTPEEINSWVSTHAPQQNCSRLFAP